MATSSVTVRRELQASGEKTLLPKDSTATNTLSGNGNTLTTPFTSKKTVAATGATAAEAEWNMTVKLNKIFTHHERGCQLFNEATNFICRNVTINTQ